MVNQGALDVYQMFNLTYVEVLAALAFYVSPSNSKSKIISFSTIFSQNRRDST